MFNLADHITPKLNVVSGTAEGLAEKQTTINARAGQASEGAAEIVYVEGALVILMDATGVVLTLGQDAFPAGEHGIQKLYFEATATGTLDWSAITIENSADVPTSVDVSCHCALEQINDKLYIHVGPEA